MGKRRSSIYTISQDTKAIMTKETGYYRTLIIEGNKKKPSNYKIEQILNYNCLLYGSDLAGRKKGVKRILKSASKLPIPVDPANKGIYMMPTASIKNKDCVWLAYHHIKFYEQRDHKAYIGFHDDTGIYINASVKTIDLQYKRTSEVIVDYNRDKIFKGFSLTN
ncbi:competence protein ComK [Virgibacillus natechei]|uniref:Competence protein ComK n=1 Tax=Virgibacillus natechei TaxID=1216297 RepID=A0ABS4IL28_9BACI|nr:competence protein ComK [Virgibacillus natechei]MBP1971677.1 competence protein ComK [Virgibacillus natechei]UZD12567.1 competence protein ComK [Virgibacillus natechei]